MITNSSLTIESTIPKARITRLPIRNGAATIAVVRDDFLPGGTKQRAFHPYVKHCLSLGYEELVYASPFAGYAQVALAICCRDLGMKCTIFSSRDPSFESLSPSLVAAQIVDFANVHVHVTNSYADAERDAADYVSVRARSRLIPLGGNCPIFRSFLCGELAKQWRVIRRNLRYKPERVWVSVGSGTLATTLRNIIRPEVAMTFVDVGVLPDSDHRIQYLLSLPNVTYIRAVEPFRSVANIQSPISSNRHYDAKVWQYVSVEGGDHDIWWNVSR